MQTIEQIPTLEGRATLSWPRILLGSVLAVGGALAMTGIIAVFQLYPLIPNISILYLLVILALASTFGLYAAVLASVTAFLAFDYFLVPPLYVFTIDRWEEWIALFVFLATALLTSQLTVIMRARTAQAQLRERESKILYEVIRLTNSQERFENQLSVVALSLVRVFTSWGVRACGFLLPDTQGNLMLVADASPEGEAFDLSTDERVLAVAVLNQGHIVEERLAPRPDYRDDEHRISQYSTIGPVTIVRFIPLKTEEQVLGVLCLRIQHPVSWFASAARMQQTQASPNTRTDFFWTFLEQATSILERVRLRSALVSGKE